MTNLSAAPASIDDLIDDFTFLDDWEERYSHVIELGKKLVPLDAAQKTEETKVRGCVSQVWMISGFEQTDPPALVFRGESDAHIVQGLIAILLAIYNHRSPEDILAIDAQNIFQQMGLHDALTPQRSNGLASMVQRIRADAEQALNKT